MVCKICKKPLTDPVSIELEMGPVCRGRRRLSDYNDKTMNMFSNRASYSWGVDGDILWLKDKDQGRSLTNDIENCLVEVSEELDKPLTYYRIIYQDSTGEWDGIIITKLGDLSNDIECLKMGRPYEVHELKINLFPIYELDYEKAKEKILASDRYFHPASPDKK